VQKVLWALSGLAMLAVLPGASLAGDAQTLQVAEAEPLYPDDRILGDPNAPITMIEYASLTCPHCAHFDVETLPKIKADWIDTGKVKLVYRDFPLDKYAANAALLARCMPKDRYFSFIDVLFHSQDNWAHSRDPMAGLRQLARTAGMQADAIDACLANDQLLDTMAQRVKDAQERYDINSTPSFVINGEVISGARDYEEFKTRFENAESDS
jgi:protein-disulfide isomerase